MRLRLPLGLTLSFLLLAAGCVSRPANVAVDASYTDRSGYTFDNWIDRRKELPNGDLIVLSFSGGGSRAAALAASVLADLERQQLASKIAIISSTSGGSVTAGYYAAVGGAGLPRLNDQFLSKNNTSALGWKMLPGLFVGANRSQTFADYVDATVFNGIAPAGEPVTFGHLMGRWSSAPFIIMNATDASTGSTFELTQDYFSHLCSDLARFRVSEAMAASSSFPFMMTPIPLKNYWSETTCRERIASNAQAYAIANKNRYLDLEAFVSARYKHSLRHTYGLAGEKGAAPEKPYRKIDYVHLIDGGLADNLAARALLRTFSEQTLDKLIAKGLKRVLLIQVNAKSESKRAIDSSPGAPSLKEIFTTAVLNPLDVTTALSSYVSKRYWVSLIDFANQKEPREGQRSADITFFPVQVDFDHMETGSDVQQFAKDIGTSWKMQPGQLGLIQQTGKSLLNAHPCFNAFLAASGPGFAGADGCGKVEIKRVASMAPDTSPVYYPPPPAPAPVVPPPSPVEPVPPSPVVEKVSFSADAKFDSGSVLLKREGKEKLDDLVEKIRAIHVDYINITGHTDLIEAGRNRQALSLRRAQAVVAYLKSKGISKNMLHAFGKAGDQPVADNDSADGRAHNRRVEIEVMGSRRP